MHATERDYTPLGAALVLDRQRLLTSTHIIRFPGSSRPVLWAAFPFAGPRESLTRVRVGRIRPAQTAMADLSVLELVSPVPDGVVAARVRCPVPEELEGLHWWAFGFPGGDWKGNDAGGVIGRALGYGWVRLDTQSQYVVQEGFSGGGLWCPDYDAVIGTVGQADADGNGQAITLHYADEYLPREKIHLLARWTIQAADDIARQAWGWALTSDAEADRHWRPRARGVTANAEQGYRFQGRVEALREIITCLDRAVPDNRVLVVTGSPGVGKSAVLGRIVITADTASDALTGPAFDVTAGRATDRVPDDAATDAICVVFDRDLLPGLKSPRATTGSVACAIHAKGKTALDVAQEIARAASTPLPNHVGDLPGALRAVLSRRRQRFNLVIDALDEASDPRQVRVIVRELIQPIAVDCADVGAQVLVGTRRFDAEGDLLGLFTPEARVIDLDDPAYFELVDLAAYAQATLQLRGAERPGNPYKADDVAAPVAARIAELADRNFLIAGLVARTHGLYDRHPVAVDCIHFPPRVRDALGAFVRHLAPIDDIPAADVLAGLAWIEAPGVPVELWQTAVAAITGRQVAQDSLREFAHASAANFVIEFTEHAEPVYRLFHQALNDALVYHEVSASNPEAAVAAAFIAYGRQHGWDHAPTYLRRSLPDHARRAGLVDQLVTDVEYTLYADLRRLIPAAADATTPVGRQSLPLLLRTPGAADADPATRLALFSPSARPTSSIRSHDSDEKRSRIDMRRHPIVPQGGRLPLHAHA